MDFEKLQRKRQLNVQQQNELLRHRILKEACYWRERGIPMPLKQVIEEKGIDSDKCIMLEYEQNFPGCCTDEGMVLTDVNKFYRFEMDLSCNKADLIKLYLWSDVTDDIEVNAHKPGIGATFGYLAIKVLSELNCNQLDC